MKQLDLGLPREREKDRNFHLGGRSFYFFDFDDNIAFLSTPLVLFHKETGAELPISSGEFAQNHHGIGRKGIYQDYFIDYNDRTGTFRYFRDHDTLELERLERKNQVFVDDVAHALGFPDFHWQGPSWNCFYHAVFNERPVSLITARGHDPQTLRKGLQLFVQSKVLPQEPNYLGLFPVSHIPTRRMLGDEELNLSVPELKKRAIHHSFHKAIEVYGESHHHRFGMSDDDPRNIEMIYEALRELKILFPRNSFFVIDTTNGQFTKIEVAPSARSFPKNEETKQLSFW